MRCTFRWLLLLCISLNCGFVLANQPPSGAAKGQALNKLPRTDPLGDPLPAGAIARLGTTRFQDETAEIYDIGFSTDGKTIFTIGNGSLTFFDALSGKQLRRLPDLPMNRNSGHALTPDGKTLAIGDVTWVLLWDMATGDLRYELPGRTGGVKALTLVDGGETLVCVLSDSTVMRWEVATGKLKSSAKLFGANKIDAKKEKEFGAVVLSRDAKTLVAEFEKSAIVVDVTTGKVLWQLPGSQQTKPRFALSADGKQLAISIDGATIVLYETATGKELARRTKVLPIKQGLYYDFMLAMSPDGKTVALAQAVRSLAFSDDGKLLASGSEDTTVLIWDLHQTNY